jgi:hypothetical protein
MIHESMIIESRWKFVMTHNRSVVDNLVPTKNRGNSAEFSEKQISYS